MHLTSERTEPQNCVSNLLSQLIRRSSYRRAEISAVSDTRHAKLRRSSSAGFTLVEMLVVIAIIGILIAMLFPALQAVRQAARQSQCSANLRQIILATLNMETTRLKFPAGDNGEGGSFVVELLPFLKQEFLHERATADLEGQTYAERLEELCELDVQPLLCPAAFPSDSKTNVDDQGDFTTHYYGIAGPIGDGRSSNEEFAYEYDSITTSDAGPIGLQGIFSPNNQGVFKPRAIRDVRDGTSYTFGLGEISGFDNSEFLDQIERGGWAFGATYDRNEAVEIYGVKSVRYQINRQGGELNDQPHSSNHPNGAQFALLDGAVRYVDERISLDILKAFCSIDEVERPEKLDDF